MSKRLMDPRKRDGSFPFKYVPASHTNVSETIKRERERLAQEPKDSTVTRIQRRKP